MNRAKPHFVIMKIAVISILMCIQAISTAKAGRLSSENQSSLNVDTDPYSLINEVNSLRQANGLPPYSINSILMGTAQQHAQYMSVAGVTHFGADGSSPWQRALAAGYPLGGDLSLGGFFSENIIAGVNKSVQDAVTAWQGDAPHLNTMLSANLTEIGAGVAVVGDYVYYVIDCARPTNSGQPQAVTSPVGGTILSSTSVPAAPLVLNTIVAATPLNDGKIVHIVKPGETLWLIAVSYGVKVADIRKNNNLSEAEAVYPGEKLFIKQQSTFTPAPPTLTSTLTPPSSPTTTNTLPPSSTMTATEIPVAAIPSSTSTLVLGIIIGAAFVLAAVLVWGGTKK